MSSGYQDLMATKAKNTYPLALYRKSVLISGLENGTTELGHLSGSVGQVSNSWFPLSHDLTVGEFKPLGGLCPDGGVPAGILSLFLSSPPVCVLSFSLSLNINYK